MGIKEKKELMKEEIKKIIESYCQGIEWLEFNINDLDNMTEEIQNLKTYKNIVFKLKFNDKIEFVQAKSQLDLIRNYQAEYEFDIYDLNEITEISEEEAKTIMLSNNEYNSDKPEDEENFKEFSLFDAVSGDDFCIIGSSEWD